MDNISEVPTEWVKSIFSFQYGKLGLLSPSFVRADMPVSNSGADGRLVPPFVSF